MQAASNRMWRMTGLCTSHIHRAAARRVGKKEAQGPHHHASPPHPQMASGLGLDSRVPGAWLAIRVSSKAFRGRGGAWCGHTVAAPNPGMGLRVAASVSFTNPDTSEGLRGYHAPQPLICPRGGCLLSGRICALPADAGRRSRRMCFMSADADLETPEAPPCS